MCPLSIMLCTIASWEEERKRWYSVSKVKYKCRIGYGEADVLYDGKHSVKCCVKRRSSGNPSLMLRDGH